MQVTIQELHTLIRGAQIKAAKEFATRLIEEFKYLLAGLPEDDSQYIEDAINQELEYYKRELKGK